MNNYKPIKPLPGNDADDYRYTDDQKYWNSIKVKKIYKQGNITSLDVMPVYPFQLASTSGMSLSVWDTIDYGPPFVYDRFKSQVYCATYRSDGALLAVGTHGGQVAFFDTHTSSKKALRNPIRLFQAHDCRINSICYTNSSRQFSSASDNGFIKLFDLTDTRTSSEPSWVCRAHTDHIRHSLFLNTSDHLMLTGSYDHSAKLWDTRIKMRKNDLAQAALNMNHEFPIERLLIFPEDRIVVTAGSTFIKFWDIAAGGRLLHTSESHGKTITSLCFGGFNSYLLTGGLDQQINILRVDTGDYASVHRIRTDGPVLAIAYSANEKQLALGTSNSLSILARNDAEKPPRGNTNEICEHLSPVPKRYKASPHSHIDHYPKYDEALLANQFSQHAEYDFNFNVVDGNNGLQSVDEFKPFNNSSEHKYLKQSKKHDKKFEQAVTGHYTGTTLEKVKLGQFDHLLRSRKYRELVTTMLDKQNVHNSKPEIFVAVFHQLCIRQVLPQSLAGHSREHLIHLFRFIQNHLFKPAFFDVLFDVCNTLITIYADLPNKDVAKMLKQTSDTIMNEIEVERIINQVSGSLTMLHAPPN